MEAEQEADIRNRLNKAKNAFRMLNNAWKSSRYSAKTKLLSTLLYDSEYSVDKVKEL